MAGNALLLAALLALLIAAGVPVAYALGAAATVTMLTTVDALPALTTSAQRIATSLDSFALLAIPFFILSGQLMNRGGAARRLVALARALMGGLPAGLALVHILACLLFGAISGSAVAAAAAIGGFMAPIMEREGYDRGYAAAVNITSSTTGLLIPPSNILIIYSLASGGVSIAALFVAGYLPGVLVGLLLMATSILLSRRQRLHEAPRVRTAELWRCFVDALPSLALIVVVMGGIVGGIFTATEAAGVAVAYAFVLTVVFYREVAPRDLPRIAVDTAITTGVVMLLIGTSSALSWVMAYERIPQTLATALVSVTDERLLILLLINLTLLAVGTFLDMTPAVLIFTPIFLPIVTELGLDPVHFGVIMVLNLCIGLCTPPVGTVLFVGTGVARVPLSKVVPQLLPLYLAMVAALILVTLIPGLSLWLPGLFGL